MILMGEFGKECILFFKIVELGCYYLVRNYCGWGVNLLKIIVDKLISCWIKFFLDLFWWECWNFL